MASGGDAALVAVPFAVNVVVALTGATVTGWSAGRERAYWTEQKDAVKRRGVDVHERYRSCRIVERELWFVDYVQAWTAPLIVLVGLCLIPGYGANVWIFAGPVIVVVLCNLLLLASALEKSKNQDDIKKYIARRYPKNGLFRHAPASLTLVPLSITVINTAAALFATTFTLFVAKN